MLYHNIYIMYHYREDYYLKNIYTFYCYMGRHKKHMHWQRLWQILKISEPNPTHGWHSNLRLEGHKSCDPCDQQPLIGCWLVCVITAPTCVALHWSVEKDMRQRWDHFSGPEYTSITYGGALRSWVKHHNLPECFEKRESSDGLMQHDRWPWHLQCPSFWENGSKTVHQIKIS